MQNQKYDKCGKVQQIRNVKKSEIWNLKTENVIHVQSLIICRPIYAHMHNTNEFNLIKYVFLTCRGFLCFPLPRPNVFLYWKLQDVLCGSKFIKTIRSFWTHQTLMVLKSRVWKWGQHIVESRFILCIYDVRTAKLRGWSVPAPF